MDYTLESLMAQLGLEGEHELAALRDQHGELESGTSIMNAPYWSDSQSAFLREAIETDGPWSVAVGQLDALLRDQN